VHCYIYRTNITTFDGVTTFVDAQPFCVSVCTACVIFIISIVLCILALLTYKTYCFFVCIEKSDVANFLLVDIPQYNLPNQHIISVI
jgi:hypothetical protein